MSSCIGFQVLSSDLEYNLKSNEGHPGRSSQLSVWLYLKRYFLMFIFWERGRLQAGKGRERGRDRIGSRLQALSCQHRASHGAWTHEPWDQDLSRSWRLNWLSHPGTPSVQLLISAQVMMSLFLGSSQPHFGLCTDSMEFAWDSLPHSLSAPPPHTVSQNK